jgi:hypothetical protein
MLYEDDMCHPLNQECEPVISSRFDNNTKVKKIMSNVYQSNKGFHLLKRQTKDNKRHNVEVFVSGDQGSTIRNAISGSYYYGDRVGSKQEDLYFKVSISTGELGKDSVVLFYDTPEQYERHMYATVDSETKQMWLEKQVNVKLVK